MQPLRHNTRTQRDLRKICPHVNRKARDHRLLLFLQFMRKLYQTDDKVIMLGKSTVVMSVCLNQPVQPAIHVGYSLIAETLVGLDYCLILLEESANRRSLFEIKPWK